MSKRIEGPFNEELSRLHGLHSIDDVIRELREHSTEPLWALWRQRTERMRNGNEKKENRP